MSHFQPKRSNIRVTRPQKRLENAPYLVQVLLIAREPTSPWHIRHKSGLAVEIMSKCCMCIAGQHSRVCCWHWSDVFACCSEKCCVALIVVESWYVADISRV